MNDKLIEKKRYDNLANLLLQKKKKVVLNQNLDSSQYSNYLNIPTNYYFNLFKSLKKNSKLLEIGAGTGTNTTKLLDMSFDICATDISPKSVEVMNKKFSKYKNFSSKVADMEDLPFKKESFDIICSSGSLSYGNNDIVIEQIYRLLKPQGRVVILDSLNNSPIYKLNRLIHYYKGNRTKSTLERMPDLDLINKYIKKFGYGKVKYFGSITWAYPILNVILTENLVCKFSNWIDEKFKIKGSAFKFVLILNKNK